MSALPAAQRWEVAALGDANMRTLQKGDVLQLERKGYFIVDEPLARLGRPAVLFAIPDGKPRPIIEPPDPSYYPSAAPAAPAAASAKGAAAAAAVPAAKGAAKPVETPSLAADPTEVSAGVKAAAGAAVAAAAQAAGAAVAGSAAAAAGGMRRLLHPEGGEAGVTPSPTPQPSGNLGAQV